MKKKILAICLVAVMALTAIAGASLAYFTDKDEAKNDFTAGKVDITLKEDFKTEDAKLVPGVDIKKEAKIKLEADSVDSYVWLTYAIPVELDNTDGNNTYNKVHVNFPGRFWDDYRKNRTYWEDGQTEAKPLDECWDVDYEKKSNVKIGEEYYNVYTCLYHGKLSAGEETTIGMSKVYLDTHVDYDNETGKYTFYGEEINYDLTHTNIIVTAYAIQAATFNDVYEAYAAYNAQPALPTGVSSATTANID